MPHMHSIGRDVARVARLSPNQLRLLVAAAPTLAMVSAALAVLPFQRAIRLGQVPLVPGRRSAWTLDDMVWAVKACALRLPMRTKCIEQGIALQRMLRREGVDATLHYGARQPLAGTKLEAHVWVTVEGIAIIGGDEAPEFTEIATFPR